MLDINYCMLCTWSAIMTDRIWVFGCPFTGNVKFVSFFFFFSVVVSPLLGCFSFLFFARARWSWKGCGFWPPSGPLQWCLTLGSLLTHQTLWHPSWGWVWLACLQACMRACCLYLFIFLSLVSCSKKMDRAFFKKEANVQVPKTCFLSFNQHKLPKLITWSLDNDWQLIRKGPLNSFHYKLLCVANCFFFFFCQL